MDARNRDTQEQPTKEIHEVVGVFDNLAALQSAIDQLLTDGIVLDSHLDPDGFQFVNRKFR
jgi:hypothetical protein